MAIVVERARQRDLAAIGDRIVVDGDDDGLAVVVIVLAGGVVLESGEDIAVVERRLESASRCKKASGRLVS